MLRRQARERREYLQRRAQEERLRRQQDKKEQLRQALDENRLLPTELRRQALALQKELEFETPGENGVTGSQDDEYRWAGLELPKVMVTTSRDPSSRLRVFAKELCLVIPGARRLNRGRAEVGALVSACRAAGVTDLLVLHETRGQPDGLVLCHLPHGPTAHFTLSGAVLRHEVGGLGGAPLGAPHILLHRLDSALGRRLGTILKHLFPVPRPQTRRVVTFANEDDVILVRWECRVTCVGQGHWEGCHMYFGRQWGYCGDTGDVDGVKEPWELLGNSGVLAGTMFTGARGRQWS
uniref:IMP U3 small nucleolar ribonucleoprotein 4 n=1 Tax=Chrysolophus pictus TaxID=9089 RepID=A0A8C3LXE8_CHRPC